MNETIIQTIPTGYIPDYFLYIVTSLLLLTFGLLTYAYKSKRTNWGNFWQVILFSTLIIGIIVGFFVSMPDIFANWVTKFISLFWY